MADHAGVALEIDHDKVPFVSGARKYADMGTFAGGLFDNRSYFGPHVTFNETIDEAGRMMLFDPQTSGGLLLGVPEEQLEAFLKRATEEGQPVWEIGKVMEGKGIRVK